MLDRIFLQILNMSFTASYVILCIILARIVLQKAPKIFSYALWSVALFRLTCPWSFESVLSLLAIGRRTTEQLHPFSGQYVTLSTARNGVVSSGDIVASTGIANTSSTPFVGNILAFLWLAGVTALLIYSFVTLFKLQKRLRGAVCEKDKIYLSECLSTPFVMGVIHPRVYLPGSLSGAEKEYILLHEQTHIRRLDHVVKLLSFFVLCVHWFNPIVWVAFFLSGKDMEMSCDEAVIRKLGNDVKKDYSSSLLSLATGRRIVNGTPLAFGEGDTKGRIKNVLNYKKPAFWAIITVLIAVIALCVGLAANPAKALSLPKDTIAVEVDQVNENESIGIVTVTDPNQIVGIIDVLNGAKKTMRPSVSDIPPTKNYFSLRFAVGGEYKRIFIYQDDGKYYIEDPYIGVYSCDREVSVYLAKVYNEILDSGASYSVISAEVGGLLFSFSDVSTDLQTFGEAAFRTWIGTYMGENIPAVERIAEYQIERVNVIASYPKVGQGIKYQYVVQVHYGITTTSEEYRSPGDGISGKGRFEDLFRELCIRDLGNGQYDILSVGTGGGEQEFLRTVDPLETAISNAVLEHEGGSTDSDFVSEAHTTLATEAAGPAVGSSIETVTVYAMALYMEFKYQDGGLAETQGSHMPVAITFGVGEDNAYTLKEYWMPQDGAYYGPSIREKFPEEIAEDAMDTQKYIKAHAISCYEQAIAYGKVGVSGEATRLIETICSSPAEMSNPKAYIDAHPIEYRMLVYYGNNTLDYCFDLFERGGQTGLAGHIMASACQDIMVAKGVVFDDILYNTGQDWYDSVKDTIQR